VQHNTTQHTQKTPPPAAHNRVRRPPTPAPIAHSGSSATIARTPWAHSSSLSASRRCAHTAHSHSPKRGYSRHHTGETATDLVATQVQPPVVRAHTGTAHPASPITAPPTDTDAHTAQCHTTNTTPAAYNRVHRPLPPSHTAAEGPLAHKHTAVNPVTAGGAHKQFTTTHRSDDKPDTTLGKLPLIWFLAKSSPLSCAHTQAQHTPRRP
jgi:hypothetical protein